MTDHSSTRANCNACKLAGMQCESCHTLAHDSCLPYALHACLPLMLKRAETQVAVLAKHSQLVCHGQMAAPIIPISSVSSYPTRIHAAAMASLAEVLPPWHHASHGMAQCRHNASSARHERDATVVPLHYLFTGCLLIKTAFARTQQGTLDGLCC